MGMKRKQTATESPDAADATSTPKRKGQKKERQQSTSHDNSNHETSKNKKNKKHKEEKQDVAQQHLSGSTVNAKPKKLPFDFKYIMAPMVGASELPFRLLCRKYGTQLCYTPMMMASEFAASKVYRQREFPISKLDRPLVCHFAANRPEDFANAAKLAEPHCDAIDLNLGCPQRTAYVGHFGSYLLDSKDRKLICDMVQAASRAVKIPIFVKIRLLDTYEETKQLVAQIYQAGATLIAIHARYRATFHRKGPGARDGPALLDQVQKLQQEFPDRLLVTNGNTITYEDVVQNLQLTQASGLMSAEGLLDNPALFLPRLLDDSSTKQETGRKTIPVKGGNDEHWNLRREYGKKMFRKWNKIIKAEAKLRKGKALTSKEEKRMKKTHGIIAKLAALDDEIQNEQQSGGNNSSSTATGRVSYEELERVAQDKTLMALEYLQFVKNYPTTMRTTIFHTRRILKVELTRFQLMEDCLKCETVNELELMIQKIRGYQNDPSTFTFDKLKAQQEKEALERKRQEEGKRKAFEQRMIRKAKREKRQDLEFYLRQGAVVPTIETVHHLAQLSKEEQLRLWKERDHSQHCIAFHLSECQRGRACAFLHVACTNANTFDESNEVAG